MSLITVLQEERKRILGDLARVDKALLMFGGRPTTTPSLRKTATTRTPEATRVSKAAQGLRWAKQLKKGPAAVAAAKKELEAAQKALAASKK